MSNRTGTYCIRRMGLGLLSAALVLGGLPQLAGAAPGPDLAALKKDLGSKYWFTRHVAARKLAARGEAGKAALREALKSDNYHARLVAAGRLIRMGVEQEPAAEAVATVLARWSSLPLEGELALCRAGAVGVAPLAKLLDHEKEFARISAVQALVGIGPEVEGVMPALIRALGSKGRSAHEASKALVQIGAPAVAPLAEALRGGAGSRTRSYAASTLGEIGTVAAPAADALVAAMDDKSVYVRRDAAEALPKVGAKPAQAVPKLAAAVGDKDDHLCEAAAKALAKYGPAAKQAIGALKAAYKTHGGSYLNPRIEIIRALVAVGLPTDEILPTFTPMLKDSACGAAAEAISTLGPKAAPAVPDLCRRIGSGMGWPGVVKALAKIGRPAVEAVTEALKSESPLARQNAARVLGAIGPDARKATPALIGLLGKDPKPYVREMAAYALAGIAPKSPEVHEAFAAVLASGPAGIRNAVLRALAAVGPNARSLSALAQVLQDPKRMFLWHQAIGVLAKVAPKQPAARKVLLAAMAYKGAGPDDRDAGQRPGNVAQALKGLGPVGVTMLLEALRSNDARVRLAAVEALPAAGEAAVVKALAAAVADTSAPVRHAAAEKLGRIGPKARSAADALVSALSHSDERTRVAAADALARIGADRDRAAAALLALLKASDKRVRLAAAAALLRLGAQRDRAVAALAELARDTERDLPEEAVDVLTQHALGVPGTVDALAAALGHDRDSVRGRAARALGEVGPKARKALPALRKVVSRGGNAGMAAAATVLRLEPQDTDAMKLLIRNVSPSFSRAAEALARVGPAGKPAVGKLIWAMQTSSRLDTGRYAAARALGGIGLVEPEVLEVLVLEACEGTRVGSDAADSLVKLAADSPQVAAALQEIARYPFLSAAGAARKILQRIAAAKGRK